MIRRVAANRRVTVNKNVVSEGLGLDVRSGFQRNYFIFVNEDSGYEAGQKPSGHLKIEVRDGRGRLYTTVQNLRPGNGSFDYSLFLIGSAGLPMTLVYAGNFEFKPGRAELEWIFDPADVGGSGTAIEGFDVFAVIAEGAAGRDNNPACPLAAYRSKRVEWKNDFRMSRMVKKPEFKLAPKAGTKPETKQEIKQLQEKGKQPVEPQPVSDAGQQAMPAAEAEQAAVSADQPQTAEPLQTIDQGQLYQAGNPAIGDEAQVHQYGPIQQPGQFNEEGQGQQYDQSPALPDGQAQEYMPYQFYQEQPDTGFMPEAPKAVQSNETQPSQYTNEQDGSQQTQPLQDTNNEPQQKKPVQEQAVPQSEYQYPVGSGNLDTGCLYLNGNICGAILNTMSETASPCDACKIHKGEPAGQVKAAGDLSRLRAILDLNFEVSDPFHSKRSDYEWWKITNPVNLNNILYQNNIRSPLMFNPAVMLAHYKYHHLIVGIFTRKDGLKYVVCGVPGMHMVDRKPFGDMSKWVQADGGRSRYGAFGYWLVYINPNDGKILNFNQE